MFKIDVDIFVSRKKRNVHFAFEKILTSYYCFDKLILLLKVNGKKEKYFSITTKWLTQNQLSR